MFRQPKCKPSAGKANLMMHINNSAVDDMREEVWRQRPLWLKLIGWGVYFVVSVGIIAALLAAAERI